MKRLLVVVAHPDDETFGCGSLLMHAAERGVGTAVACATRGEAGEVEKDVPLPPGGRAELREGELRAAAAALGVGHVEVWDFADSGLTGESRPGSLCDAPLEVVTAKVADLHERLRPSVVVTLDGSDGHRDHLRVRAAVEQALAGSGTPLYLQCLPRSLMHAWVRHHAGDAGRSAYTELPEIGTPDEEITTVVDTTRLLTRRRAAIALHRSQRSPFDGLPDDVQRAWLGREHLQRLLPPWRGGPVEREVMGL